MPLEGIIQPDMIQIDQALRLRIWDGKVDFAAAWFADVETVYHLCGIREAFSCEDIKAAFTHCERFYEMYIVELLEGEGYTPVGWAAFSAQDMPIVIAPEYRKRKIGRRVVRCFIQRGQQLQYDELMLRRIFDDNPAALRCYTAAGFRVYAITSDSSLLSILL